MGASETSLSQRNSLKIRQLVIYGQTHACICSVLNELQVSYDQAHVSYDQTMVAYDQTHAGAYPQANETKQVTSYP
jgi:hypothetical protein